jgi:N-acetylglucosamine transport system permease protein
MARISSRPAPTAGVVAAKTVIYALLFFWALLVIVPMLWTIVSSLKNDQEIFFSPWSLPAIPLWDNFARAWVKARLGQYLVNTLIIIIPAIFFTVLLSSMVAYVLARFEFRGRSFVFYLFLLGMMFPVFLGLVPLYFIMQWLGLKDTFHGLILVYIAYSFPFTVFFLTGFFKTLPKEMGEAALIDGANQYQTFFLVYLPLAQPGLIPVIIFNFLGQWNQYILPNVLMSNAGLSEDQTRYVLSQGLFYLQNQQQYANDWSGLFAAVTLVMIPTLIVYVIFHDRIEKGLTVGAVKG